MKEKEERYSHTKVFMSMSHNNSIITTTLLSHCFHFYSFKISREGKLTTFAVQNQNVSRKQSSSWDFGVDCLNNRLSPLTIRRLWKNKLNYVSWDLWFYFLSKCYYWSLYSTYWPGYHRLVGKCLNSALTNFWLHLQ